MMKPRAILSMLKAAGKEWSNDQAPMLGAALAYYTIFSIAPLLLIATAIAGLAFGQEAAQGQIMSTFKGLLGSSGADAVQTMVASARKPGAGIIATVIGVVTLLLGASGVFTQLQTALNTIWHVPSKAQVKGIWGFIRNRFLSFAMVLGIGFLLMVSLLLSTALTAAGSFISQSLPGGAGLWEAVNFVVSFAIVTGLFAMMFKFLPDVRISWRDVTTGALITAALFTVGKTLIGLYLGTSSIGSSYGAAGSLVIMLVWVYYSAQILLYGAEFTQVYTKSHGSLRKPVTSTISLSEQRAARYRSLS